MEDLIEFFLKTGEVKRLKQRGLILRGVKDPANIGEHNFRETLMGWVLTTSFDVGVDPHRIIKISLVRDLASGYAGDPTPYEPLIWKHEGQDIQEVFKKWIRLPKEEKEQYLKEKLKQQRTGLENLLTHLPDPAANEMEKLWTEYENQTTQEARFVYQLHFLEDFIQALEYWKEDKSFPIESWWHQMKELISEPVLVELLGKLDQHFYGKSNHKNN